MTPKALRSIRLALGLSLSEFAKKIDVPEQELIEMELGRRPINIKEMNPHLEKLAPLPPLRQRSE